jgi:hypothetical protein
VEYMMMVAYCWGEKGRRKIGKMGEGGVYISG